MSFCPSSGGNFQPCSQSQKMSIGMVVDSLNAKPRYGTTKEPEVSFKHAEKGVSKREHFSVQQQSKVSATTNTQCQVPVPEGSANKVQAGDLGSGKEGKKDVTIDKYEVCSRGSKEDFQTPVKGLVQEQPNEVNRSKEILRMKLREILGNVPSASRASMNVGTGANDPMQDQNQDPEACSRPHQNSDTIETDSENADEVIRAPVTRSLARKRVPARSCPRNSKAASVSRGKGECQANSIFSYAEKSPQPREVNLGCLMPEKNDVAKKSCGVKPVKTRGKKLPPAEEVSLREKTKSLEHACPNENLELKKTTQNMNSMKSPDTREKDQQRDADCPVPPEESDRHASFNHQSPTRHNDELTRPLFKAAETSPKSPIGSLPLVSEKKRHIHEAVQAKEGTSLKAACLFKSSSATKKDDSESSDDTVMPSKAYASTSEPSMEEEAENGLSTPEKREFDSTAEVLSAKKVYPEDIHTSPETGVFGKPMLFRTKRHCSHDVEFRDFSPTSHTPKASMDTDDASVEGLEESPEDGFARVVSLLSLALERVSNKMMSVTNKRCSDILMSASEEIHSQLQDVESQIQTDLGRLTSVNKAKRKHLVIRLQEQQERLKVIYDKFREEIGNCLKDCRGQMEVLEAQHVELKAAFERQKASHRKLLLQADAAVETHLNEAKRQITSIQKLRRQKMLKLKVAIAECLKDGNS